jgi:hypothetical protein
MANTYTTIQAQRAILNKLYNRYNAVTKKVKMFGDPVSTNPGTVSSTTPKTNYQTIYDQAVDYDSADPNPQIITVKDLQKAINFLENRFSNNCNCANVPDNCTYTMNDALEYDIHDRNGNKITTSQVDEYLTCQAQCTNDKGKPLSTYSCQYVADRIVCQSYACQTLVCQTVSTRKSCEECQSCQLCQAMEDAYACQSCQLFSCQTVRCEAPKPQCACQECQTDCSQCSCQSIGYYQSCQTQCK